MSLSLLSNIGAWARAPLLNLAPAGSGPFVSRYGPMLYANGAPWRFVGYDMYALSSYAYGHNCGGWLTDSQLAQVLDEMKGASGATVVRTWFFQAYGGPGNWFQFDRVLNAAAARGVKIIPVLTNQWGDCEPWPPSGQRPYHDLAWYEQGYRSTDYGYSLSFRDYAAALAQHYANNSTIAFWQLVNEGEAADYDGGPCEEGQATAAIRGFADDVASAMKSADPHHLVSLGTLGGGQCGTASSSDYEYVHAGAIDICEYHDYSAGTLIGDEPLRIDECKALGKPTFVGESGISASVGPNWTGWDTGGSVTGDSLARRAAYFGAKMSAQFGYGAVGFLVWEKSLSPSNGWDVGPGDPVESVMAATQSHLDGTTQGPSPGPNQGNSPPNPQPSRSVGPSSTPQADASILESALSSQPTPAAMRALDAASSEVVDASAGISLWLHYPR